MRMIILIFLCCLVRIGISELESQLFDLPSLNVKTNQLYLHKKNATNLTCELTAGYSEARMQSVIWLKDKEFIDINDTDYEWKGFILTIHGTRPQNEGEYQCLAEINKIRLSNRQLITTTIISSPLKIRRARFTKFDETYVNHAAITVRENEVARIPCAGMPDVIPSPATLCFQRLESDDECLGGRNDTKYFISETGMQISLVTPSDAGFYHCVVTNEFTGQTRKSPKPVLIIVKETNSTKKTVGEVIKPVLVYPSKETTIDKPIDLAVAEGEDVILECVINMAKVVWITHNDTTPNVTMDDNTSRFQQIWGNLRIRSVALGDAGIYSCLGLPILSVNESFDGNRTRPRVDYNLVVYSPSGVRLSITAQYDKRYMLECLATNLLYEIPTAYINGTSIVHNINAMGIPSNTNFYTNPIRVHMEVKTSFTGSIQCVSRPAMVEGEIYGYGLERGKSMNMYVMNIQNSNDLIIKGPHNITVHVGHTADFPCIVQRVKARSWMKNNRTLTLFTARRTILGSNSLRIHKVELGDEGIYTCVAQSESGHTSRSSAYLTVIDNSTTTAPVVTSTEPFLDKKKDMKIDVEDVRGFVTGTEVRIQWSVLGKMEALTKVAKFLIEAQRFGTPEDSWIEAETVDSHVRATTIKSLIPDNKYKFRIKMVRDDGTHVVSLPTDFMSVEATSGDVLPMSPKILSVYQTSADTAKVLFSHNVLIENAAARTFVIIYNEVSSEQNKSQVIQVDGDQTDATITGLTYETEYLIRVLAENSAGKSLSSPEYLFETTHSGMLSSVRIFIGSIEPHLTFKNIALGGIITFLALIAVLVCFFVFCNLRPGKQRQKSQANGKFLDTSYRIFNEQKVHKSRGFDTQAGILEPDVDECSPLKVRQVDERLSGDSDKYGFNNHDENLPNLYGNMDDIMDMEEQAEIPNDPTYVSASKMTNDYGVHSTARCYSPESRTSHEMLVSYSRSAPHSTANSSSPQMNGSMQRVKAYNYADSLLYSPAGTTSSIAETNSSGTGPIRAHCDSPNTAPASDESDQGIRCGGSSRNSHISSTDGAKVMTMGTFKGSTPTSSFVSTFDRRRSENVA
ncbi:hypothetical protein GCK72_025246 [Caenorhabditis remanei]|uniref:CRE-RIG-1 protein n=1 Tax=Caenorhabditis remanei TaxID=31234 RepID=E3MUI4_CAERE|nr:hypothetical protein GCK72_025246 [Caenorhabditis remanei]EFP09713.1 CRE-RIG-1 protein [Caenorhabditis remanei]KAF1748779.1 hypothetical protein GCK72_025246 [Caenorhabditis remanei]